MHNYISRLLSLSFGQTILDQNLKVFLIPDQWENCVNVTIRLWKRINGERQLIWYKNVNMVCCILLLSKTTQHKTKRIPYNIYDYALFTNIYIKQNRFVAGALTHDGDIHV